GHIAVIGSVAGDRIRRSNYVYGTSKSGLALFAEGLRLRLAPANVPVLVVKPGFVDTPMTAHLKKSVLFASPQYVARGILRAVEAGKNEIYLPGFWRLIMLVIRQLPYAVMKRLPL
ncbi:MAG TPA: SDR family NAD(P)-dependent oxidoreductase, partial [Bryobacteraceae bacterium]|nr:SDR family NAD(P)-dependent oxidoreductase [Bryobacteraceae bacterium]